MRRRRQRHTNRMTGKRASSRKKKLSCVCVPEFYDDTFCFFNDEERRRKRRALVFFFTLEGNEIKETCACHLSFQYSCNPKKRRREWEPLHQTERRRPSFFFISAQLCELCDACLAFNTFHIGPSVFHADLCVCVQRPDGGDRVRGRRHVPIESQSGKWVEWVGENQPPHSLRVQQQLDRNSSGRG